MSTSMYRWCPIFSMDFLHGNPFFIGYVPYFLMIFTLISPIFPWCSYENALKCRGFPWISRFPQDQGFGVEAGIPTMVVAAAPLDDVLSIAGWMWADFLRSFHQKNRKKTCFFFKYPGRDSGFYVLCQFSYFFGFKANGVLGCHFCWSWARSGDVCWCLEQNRHYSMHYIVDVKDSIDGIATQQEILCPISCWNRVGFCNHTWLVREIYASVFVDSNKVLVPPLKNTSLQAIKLAQSTNFWETQIIVKSPWNTVCWSPDEIHAVRFRHLLGD